MIISIILTILLVFIAVNTKVNGESFPKWGLYSIALLTLASWESAIVMLCICIYCLYKGVSSGNVSTLKWIEDLIKHV